MQLVKIGQNKLVFQECLLRIPWFKINKSWYKEGGVTGPGYFQKLLKKR